MVKRSGEETFGTYKSLIFKSFQYWLSLTNNLKQRNGNRSNFRFPN